MNTIYGSTLDSLSANELAGERQDQSERNSYRNYLNQVAQTNLQRLNQEAMDRYRGGELGLRGKEVDNTGAYQKGLIDNSATAERNRLELGHANNRLLQDQLDFEYRRANLPYEAVPAMSPEQSDLMKATAEEIRARAKAATLPGKDAQVMNIVNQNDILKDHSTKFADLYNKIIGAYEGSNSGLTQVKPWSWQSSEAQAVHDLVTKDPSFINNPQAAAAAIAKQRFAMMYPNTPLFRNSGVSASADHQAPSPTLPPPLIRFSGSNQNAPQASSPIQQGLTNAVAAPQSAPQSADSAPAYSPYQQGLGGMRYDLSTVAPPPAVQTNADPYTLFLNRKRGNQ